MTSQGTFLSRLCLAELQVVDGLGEVPGAPEVAGQLAEDAPRLELGARPLSWCAELRVHLIACFWDSGLFLPLYGIFAGTRQSRSCGLKQL